MSVKITEPVAYAEVFGYRPLRLDAYLPDTSAACPPVVLFLHGGGWALGDSKLTVPAFDNSPEPVFFTRLAAAGLAVVSAEYRLSGEAAFPAQLHDVKAAVRWVRRNAGEYGWDADRIVAFGMSAGAHLAALLGLTGDSDDLAIEGDVGQQPQFGPPGAPPGPPPEPVSTAVAAVIDWFGPADLITLAAETGGEMEHDSPQSPEGRLIGGRVSENPKLARDASPLSYVHRGAPPFLIIHGTADNAVPVTQSQALASALSAEGAEVEAEWVPGAGHAWVGAPPGQVEAIFDRSVAFAKRITGR